MSCVYVLKGTDAFCDRVLYKVGQTSFDDPEGRLISINTGLKPFASVEVYKYWSFVYQKDAVRVEGLLHVMFSHRYISGEWFDFTDDDLELLDIIESDTLGLCLSHNINSLIDFRSLIWTNYMYENYSVKLDDVTRNREDYYTKVFNIDTILSDNFVFGGLNRMTGEDICTYLISKGFIREINKSNLTSIGIALRKMNVRKYRPKGTGSARPWIYEGISIK